jgi:hypothetical protein
MAILKVRYIDDLGRPSDPVNGYPCVDLRMSFRSPHDPAGNPISLEDVFPIVAVIDTGAHISGIVPRCIPHWARAEIVTKSTGITGVGTSNIYRATVYVEDAKWMAAGVLFGSISMENTPFDVVLGREFLRHTSFDYDGDSGITWLKVPTA